MRDSLGRQSCLLYLIRLKNTKKASSFGTIFAPA